MIKYKEMLVTLNKEVKKLDRIHRAVRKTTNEFTSISMECFLDNYSYLIEADESWYKPKAERNREGKIELTPEYNFSLANRHRGYFEWDLLQPWSPKYVKEDVGTYRGHRPVTITRGVTETRADFVFIYTKKHLLNYQLIHAFNNMILGKRRKWLEEDVGYPEGRYDEVDRDLKTELDLMNDDDIIFITARGYDQEDGFEIEAIDMWDVETGQAKDFGFTNSYYPQDTEEFVRGILRQVIELDTSNEAMFWLYD
tara:strand:+ start:44 stop:805 length:762 start_codon:yes stop_codon:yes gene_type:complete